MLSYDPAYVHLDILNNMLYSLLWVMAHVVEEVLTIFQFTGILSEPMTCLS
jgi:hypothetical protein